MNKQGFIKISRKFFRNELWMQPRVYTQAEAWIDLIQLAHFEEVPGKRFIRNTEITWQRGQYPASIRYLAKKWEWSLNTVRAFLLRLEKREMISIEHSQGINIITLCNYNLYNQSHTANNTECHTQHHTPNKQNNKQLQTATTQQSHRPPHTKHTNIKKEKEQKKEKIYSPPTSPERGENENNDYLRIINEFNRMFDGKISPVRVIDKKRKNTIDWRIAEYGADSIKNVFKNLLQAPIWHHKQPENEKIDFDWVMRRRNFVKLLEKNYQNLSQYAKYQRHTEPERPTSAGIKSHSF